MAAARRRKLVLIVGGLGFGACNNPCGDWVVTVVSDDRGRAAWGV